jgi:type IV pilus assembly protein PilB
MLERLLDWKRYVDFISQTTTYMTMPMKNKKKPERRKRLGEYLVDAGLIDEKAIEEALKVQKTNKKRLGQILIQLGVADEQVIAKALASQLKIPFIRLDKVEIPDEVISLIPADMVKKYLLVPIEQKEKTLLVVMANPLELYAREDLRFVTGLSIDAAIAPEKDIIEAIEQYYKEQDLEEDLQPVQAIEEGIEFIPQEDEEDEDVEDLMDLTERPPVVRFINILFANAITQRASDIHIEPQKANVIIRHRVDGIMREVMRTEKHAHRKG